jgi:hypothetical protein
MPDRKSSKKKPGKRKPADEDENVIAHRIVDEATEESPQGSPPEEPTEDERRAAARMLGRRGGLKGGPARANKLSKRRRSEIARKAAQKRWNQPSGGKSE